MHCAIANPIHIDTEATRIQHNNRRQPLIWHLNRNSPTVSLTFDDGPDEHVTPKILYVLKQKNVLATFFLIGHMIVKHPHIVQQILADGHHIANHSWAHYRLDELSESQIKQQIQATTHALSQLNVPQKPLFRPPGGRYNQWVLNAVQHHHMTMVMWDVNAADYRLKNGRYHSKKNIVQRVMSRTKPGSIILMHNSAQTVAVLPTIIDRIRNQGLAFTGIQQ